MSSHHHTAAETPTCWRELYLAPPTKTETQSTQAAAVRAVCGGTMQLCISKQTDLHVAVDRVAVKSVG